MLRLVGALCMAIALGVTNGTIGGGQQSSPSRLRDSIRARVRAVATDSIPADITSYFVGDSREHARKLASMLQESRDFYRDSLHVDVALNLAVLDSARWVQVSPQPYGLLNVDAAMVFMPATPHGVVAEAYRRLEPRLPRAVLDSLAKLHLSWENAINEMVDLVAYHEIGHSFIAQFGIRAPNLWLNEMLATYLAYAFMRARHPELASLWDVMCDADLAAYTPVHRTLEDLETLYSRVGADNYVWYQSQLQPRIRAIYSTQGFDFLRRVKEVFPIGTATLPPSEVLQRLERVAPGFTEWAKVFAQ